MIGPRLDGRNVTALLVASVGLLLASPAAHAAGTITISKAVMVEKESPYQEVTSGYAMADLNVDFKGEAACTCTCDDSKLTYEWHFGDETTANGKNVSHSYAGSKAGNREPCLHVACDCGATADSSKLSVSAIAGIRVDRIGDQTDPITTNGRLCFNTKLRIKATALPSGVNGSDKIDWSLLFGTLLQAPNTNDGNLPSPPNALWPTANAGWGSGSSPGYKLYISIDGSLVAGQDNELRLTGVPSYISNNKDIKIFYDANGFQNPDGTNGNPNWYYYWANALAVDFANYSYNSTLPTSRTQVNLQTGEWTIEIAPNARWPGAGGNPPTGERYINGFWATHCHEHWHRDHILHDVNVHGGYPIPNWQSDDIDQDKICDHEPGDPPGHGGGWEATIGTNPNVWNSEEDGANWAETVGTYARDQLDWSHPGIQWE